MSSLLEPWGRRHPGQDPAQAVARQTWLQVVPRRRVSRARVPFVFVVVLVLAAGVVGLLLVNTSLQQGAFRVAALQTKASTLLARSQGLELEVDALRDPQRVAQRAQALGMVPNPNPAFLRLSDGRILGVARPAVAGSGPRVGSVPATVR